jgi:hypothetical protein
MYVECGDIIIAQYSFDKMLEENVVTWNAMIFGYAQIGYASEALELS